MVEQRSRDVAIDNDRRVTCFGYAPGIDNGTRFERGAAGWCSGLERAMGFEVCTKDDAGNYINSFESLVGATAETEPQRAEMKVGSHEARC